MHWVEMSTKTEKSQDGAALAVYNGGPLWKNGYEWYNVFWGAYWTGSKLVNKINSATKDIKNNPSYSGGLAE